MNLDLKRLNAKIFLQTLTTEKEEKLKYKHLTIEERYHISALKKAKFSQKYIANEIETAMLDGEKKKQIEIAKNLLDVLDTETIALKTELTIKKVEFLKNSKL